MKMMRLAWMLLRGGGKRAVLGSALTFVAVAVSTALLMFAIAGNFGFAERGERSAWRTPVAADGAGTAVQAVGLDAVGGQEITVVYLAALADDPPVPPGMAVFPQPGEVWVSDAFGDLAEELPSWQLADRYGQPDGRLGGDAVIHDEELVVVVGADADDPAFGFAQNWAAEATQIDRFNTAGSNETYALYRALMIIATVLMAVPLLVFGGAAARLTVARRDQRLAALRLMGATPGQVVRLTVAEAVLTAAVGAVAGIALYALAIPLLSRIEIDGAVWRWADLWPQWWAVLATAVAIPLLVGVSAIVGLRRVVVSPLGVAKRETPPGMRAIRLAVLVVLAVAFLVMTQRFMGMGALGAGIMVALLAGTFAAINFVGPWVVWLLGKLTTSMSRRASGMLAGRRLMDDPKAAWRTVAGIALTGFVVGFIALLTPPLDQVEPPLLQVVVATEDAEAVIGHAEDTMDVISVGRDVQDEATQLYLTVDDDWATIDVFRAEVASLSPGSLVAGSNADAKIVVDIRTGALVVLSVSMLIAMVSSAVAGASSVLDRRQVYGLMHLSGTPMKVLNAARRRETLIPLLVMGLGSIGFGVVLALPMAAGTGFSGGLVALTVTVVVGLVGIMGASAVSRPLLASVMRDISPRPD